MLVRARYTEDVVVIPISTNASFLHRLCLVTSGAHGGNQHTRRSISSTPRKRSNGHAEYCHAFAQLEPERVFIAYYSTLLPHLQPVHQECVLEVAYADRAYRCILFRHYYQRRGTREDRVKRGHYSEPPADG